MAEDIRWFAGVYWASETRQVGLLDALGTVIGERAFPHGCAGLGALCDLDIDRDRRTSRDDRGRH
jgi:hypothetical protein